MKHKGDQGKTDGLGQLVSKGQPLFQLIATLDEAMAHIWPVLPYDTHSQRCEQLTQFLHHLAFALWSKQLDDFSPTFLSQLLAQLDQKVDTMPPARGWSRPTQGTALWANLARTKVRLFEALWWQNHDAGTLPFQPDHPCFDGVCAIINRLSLYLFTFQID